MSVAKRRFMPRRGFRRGRRDRPRWIASVQQSNPLAAGTMALPVLFNPATLALGGAGTEQECLVQRIVGRLIVRPLANVGGSVGVGIVKTQAGAGVFGGFLDPLVPTELAVRDWMWTQNLSWNGNAFANGHTFIRDFDIRVKRKLETDDQIRVAWSNVAGGDAVVIEIDARIVITIRL